MRAVPLTSGKGGINRLRTKGGARADTFYELENAYVTEANTVKPRPGMEEIHVLPEGTIGLTAFRQKLVVFSSQIIAMTDPLFELAVIKHPENADGELREIHFAEPFLGYLYVVAEFTDSSVYHYWLQPLDAWEANTIYQIGDLVEPTTPNGYAYRVTRLGAPYPLWQPEELRNIGDIREPTTANGFYYTITDIIQGDETTPVNVRGSDIEPTWVAEDGAVVYEDVNTGNSSPSSSPSTDGDDGTSNLPPDISGRYNRGANAEIP